MARRLREALDHRGMSQRDLARAIDYGETPLSAVLSGKSSPKPETLMSICQTLRAHPSWVLLGMEPAYFEDGDVPMTKNAPWGVDRWITESSEGRAASDDEKAWLRSVPWPSPHVRYPDMIYAMVLMAYRQTKNNQSETSLSPVAAGNSGDRRAG